MEDNVGGNATNKRQAPVAGEMGNGAPATKKHKVDKSQENQPGANDGKSSAAAAASDNGPKSGKKKANKAAEAGKNAHTNAPGEEDGGDGDSAAPNVDMSAWDSFDMHPLVCPASAHICHPWWKGLAIVYDVDHLMSAFAHSSQQ